MVALRISAQTLAHLRSVGGGLFAMRHPAHCTHLAALLAFVAGGARAQAFVDDAGRRVVVAAPARRIVSLSPAVTELLFGLGAGEQVVGRSTWCDYPPAARAIPSVGDGLTPNLEAIVARRPDLVVLYRSPLNADAAGRLAALGIPAVVLRQDLLEDMARSARVLGSLTGHGAAGDSLALVMTRVANATRLDLGRTVAFVTWDNPPIVIGGESYLDELATLAGARNVFHDVHAPSTVVSLETLVVRDPDVLVTLADSAPADSAVPSPRVVTRPEWQAVRAVRERHFVVLVGSLFGRPSPRADLAVRELRRLLLAVPARSR